MSPWKKRRLAKVLEQSADKATDRNSLDALIRARENIPIVSISRWIRIPFTSTWVHVPFTRSSNRARHIR